MLQLLFEVDSTCVWPVVPVGSVMLCVRALVESVRCRALVGDACCGMGSPVVAGCACCWCWSLAAGWK